MIRYLHRLRRNDPVDMTPTARQYLGSVVVSHGIIGLVLILRPDDFTSSSFDALRAPMPLPAWGCFYLAAAVLCAAAATFRDGRLAVYGLIGAAMVTGSWVGGFMAAAVMGDLTSPSGPAIYLGIMLRDLVVCRQPQRSPFEWLWQQMTKHSFRPVER